MDQPIIHRDSLISRKKPSISLRKPSDDIGERLNTAVSNDDIEETLTDADDIEETLTDEFYNALRWKDAFFRLNTAVSNDDIDEFLRLLKDPEYNVLMDDQSLLQCAASLCAPTVTKYLLERRDHVHVDDVLCDCQHLKLEQLTLVEFALEHIGAGYGNSFGNKRWTPYSSIFELLHCVCELRRSSLEAVRLLVQNTQNTDRVRKAFLDYAHKGKLVQLAALFLAAPELFLSSSGGGMSSIDMLYLVLNSSEKRTDIEDALLQLLDVFTLVGHKLIAYIRVDDPEVWKLNVYSNQFKIGFFVREVAHKKLGISSPDDYLLSFFKPVRREAYQRGLPDWWKNIDRKEWKMLPFHMKKKDIDMDYVNRMIPSLNHEDTVVMNTAIEKKLSTMPNLRNLYEDMIKIPTTGEKQRCSFPCVRSFEPSVRFFSTKETNAKRRFDFKVTSTNCWESRVMQPTKLKSFFSAARLSHLPMIAKRLIK